ncbi:DUF502 domain-containing protein [bacterium]|nr:DUF502 domain-containing protein [bacterium]
MKFEYLRHHLRNKFLAGLLLVLPIFITIFLIRFVFGLFEKIFAKPSAAIFKVIGFPKLTTYHLPGILGLISLILITYFVGLIVTNVIGKKTIKAAEKMLSKIPLIWSIYNSSKQIMESLSISGKKAFRQVVLVEYPRKGIYTIGFLTSDAQGEIQMVTKQETVNIFIPTTPNPTSGMLIIVPKEDLIPLSMTIEDGIKAIMSGGMVTPPINEKALPLS